jgi:hypothetical protein
MCLTVLIRTGLLAYCPQQGRADEHQEHLVSSIRDTQQYQQQQQQLPAYTTPATTAAAATTTATAHRGRSPQAAAVAADYYSSHNVVQALHERSGPAVAATGTGNSYAGENYTGGGYAERSSLDIASPPQHSTSAAAAASQVRYADTYIESCCDH